MPAGAGSVVARCEQRAASAEDPVARETGSDTAKTARTLTKSQAQRRVHDTKRKRCAPIAQASASGRTGPKRAAFRRLRRRLPPVDARRFSATRKIKSGTWTTVMSTVKRFSAFGNLRINKRLG